MVDVAAAEQRIATFLAEAPYGRGLMDMAAEGARRGWHEANGGNVSYRLRAAERSEVEAVRAELDLACGLWEDLAVAVPELGSEAFLVSAAGSFMGRLDQAPARRLGIVELDESGVRFRISIGFSDGGRPTSELAGHLLIHSAQKARDREGRVLYHAHPNELIVLSKMVELTPRAVTRALWKATTECILAVPEGVGVVPCLVPGSLELARASAEQMERFRAVLWAQHGLLCAGSTWEDAFGRMDSLVKAAAVHLATRALMGEAEAPNVITDRFLHAMNEQLHLGADDALLRSEDK